MSVALPRVRPDSVAGVADAIRDNASQIAPVALLTLIAFGLRVSQVHQTLIGDEVFSYQDVVHHSFGSVVSTVHTGGENSPPLFFVLAWASAKLGDPSVWIRLPSLLLSSATVPIVYLIGRAILGRAAGLIGSAAIALAPFAVYYGIEARPYATMAFFVALSTLALVHAVRGESTRWWAVYVLAGAAAAYSHYTAIFVLAVQGGWSLWVCRRRFRPAALANALIVVAYIPWLPHVRGKALQVIDSLYPLRVHRVLTDLLRPIPGHPSAPLRAIPTLAGLIAVGLCVLAGLAALARARSRARPERGVQPSAESVLIVALALATPIGLLVYSLVVTDIWLPRGLSASLPAASLVLGGLLAALPRPMTALAAAVVIVTLTLGTIRSFDAAYARGPYRQLAADLDRLAGPQDPVTLGTYAGAGAMLEEFHKAHRLMNSPQAMWGATAPGGTAYLVLDDTIARLLKLGTPHPRGFQLISRKRYGGQFASELITYRRLP